MSFLRTPRPFPGESFRGYLARTAAENELPFHTALDVARDSGIDLPVEGTLPVRASLWSSRVSRCCPLCLAESPHWRREWEIPFADACVRHGCWLIDTCGDCSGALRWSRPSMVSCRCGKFLGSQPTRGAPVEVVRLSSDLQALADGRRPACLAPLQGLSLDQAARLIRMIGAYGNGFGRMPQKVARIERMAVSWSMSSYAASVLATWPEGFHRMLDGIARAASPSAQGSLPRVFRGMYAAVYRGLKEPEFAFVRDAFAGYVFEYWTPSVSRRNRRLPPGLEGSPAWVPMRQAVAGSGLADSKLRKLVDEGLVAATVRTTATGRQVCTVRADSMPQDLFKGDTYTLIEAAARLRLGRTRLRRLFGPMGHLQQTFTAARIWRVDANLVDALCRVVAMTGPQDSDRHDLISIAHVLRHWALQESAIAELMLSIADGRAVPVGRVSHLSGVPSLLLTRQALHCYRQKRCQTSHMGFSVPEAASALRIKQEVAYFLIRGGLLTATHAQGPMRKEWRLRMADLEQFQERVVFARDLARLHRTSARGIAARLTKAGIAPVSGPHIDGGRQLLYFRNAVSRLAGRRDGE